MPKCVYCLQKKGKRSCPALDGLICSGCCGAHRGVAIACPEDCPHFVDHEAYQQGRLGILFFQARQPLYHELEQSSGRAAVQLLHLCDVATYQFFHNRHGTLDWELKMGLEYVRMKLSPIQFPNSGSTAYGAFLWEQLEAYCKQERVESGLAVQVMDLILRNISEFSGPGLRSNRYLKGMIGFIDQYYPDLATHLRSNRGNTGRIIQALPVTGHRHPQ